MILKKLSNKHIEEFLYKNKDFFIKNPSILSKLEFPSNISDNEKPSKVISFKDWIIENLKSKHKDFLKTAEHNYITQKKVHQSIINLIEKKNLDDFFDYLNNELRIIFDVEIISLVTSKKKFSEKFKQIYIPNDKLTLIHHKENNLIMDAVDENYGLYNQVDVKIYSNAIFSLNTQILGSPSLLVFGSKTKHFLNNKAYDLIKFFSVIFENKLEGLVNE